MNDASHAGQSCPIRPMGRRYQDLMPHRLRRILLVSSLYDSFILTEDGHLNEALLRQFVELGLTQNPDLRRVSSGAETLELLRARAEFDLVITSMHVGDMNAVELAEAVAEAGFDVPVILLAFNNRELTEFATKNDVSRLDRIFLWQGDVRILLAMVKYVEDRLNVPEDTGKMGVPAILVVEDNVRFYSSFLPAIYSELVRHTHDLISEGLNLSQKMMRMRARPKILLCTSYDEAWEYFTAYEENILGIISDIEFPRDGALARDAGVELIRQVRERRPDIPVILQSSLPQNEALAEKVDAWFLLKGSPTLLQQLRKYLRKHFGFGDFFFCLKDGSVIDRAHDLKSLVEKLKTVPAESIVFHGEGNHFSMWLKARTEYALAEKLRPRLVSDFPSVDHLRQDMIRSIVEYRYERDRAIVADFNRDSLDTVSSITRIGGGSLGGKARGLALVNRLLNDYNIDAQFSGVRIAVPYSVVLATDVFDEFMDQNELRDFAIDSTSDADIMGRFLAVPFPRETMLDLEALLRVTHYPLAVRSSGLLEDSPNQPFAGVYETYMLPNNHPDLQTRLIQLVAAVKRVYASTFSQQAKGFLRMTPYRLEEEKMAVIIQEVVGSPHDQRFYPDFSGVARSHNFYPSPPLKSEDGIVAVGLGMGKTVVDGGACLRFCPKYPRHLVAFSSVDDVLRNSQREFYALDLASSGVGGSADGAGVERYGLKEAEDDGVLAALGSTYSPDNDVVSDGISRPGVRLVSFAPVLKHGLFPLAEILQSLLEVGAQATASPVEIEFAVNLGHSGRPREFGFLQMRPLALSSEMEQLEIGHVKSSELVCRSSRILGNGKVDDLTDIIAVDYHRFDRAKSREVALHVARFNGKLTGEGRPYLLVGVGRWGSTDPYLGIPVAWSQIAGARVIVEAGFRDFVVTPSQGTHFFQNITSCNVGYFTVNPEAGDGFIDWDWLAAQPALEETEFVRHVRLDQPLTVKMSGHEGVGVILKPGEGEDGRGT